jgi:hypothetical protein
MPFPILGDGEGERHHALLAAVVSNFSLSQNQNRVGWYLDVMGD